MTLQNGMICGSRALLWADTACYDADTGKLLCYDTKAFYGLLWPFAGTLSTVGGNPHDIALKIGAAWPSNLDQLLSCTSDVVREFCKDGGLARVLLAAHDGRKPRLFMVASDGIGVGQPFEPLELSYFTSSGNRSAAFLEAQQRGMTRARMKRILDAQISTPFAGEGSLTKLGADVWIGGNIVRFEVSSKGVKSVVERELDGEAAYA